MRRLILPAMLAMGGCLQLKAVEDIETSSIGLLFRPGLPSEEERGSITLFHVHHQPVGTDEPGPGDYAQRDYGAVLIGPVHRSEASITRFYLGARQRELDGDIIFASPSTPPAEATRLPESVDEIAGGLYGKRLLEGRRAMSWRIGVASRSDRPFHSMDETGVEAEFFHLQPRQNGDAWYLGLFMNSLGRLPWIPLPGGGYVWRVDEGLTLTIGVPVVNVRWSLPRRWQFTGSASVFESGSASLTRGFGEELPVGSQYSLSARIYRSTWSSRPHRRSDEDNELTYREWRAGLAGTVRFGFIGSAGLEAGWSFKRKLREEEEVFFWEDSDHTSIVDPDDTWYLSATASMNF
ncbi:MAG: hypothetical protein ACOCXJ_03075 [Planctomycetota bacterium]